MQKSLFSVQKYEKPTVAIIDADLLFRKRHRFPNLACMKLSAYYKSKGYDVHLKLDYSNLDAYDIVTISKVFMDTEIPCEPDDKSMKTEEHIAEYYKDNKLLNKPNVQYGGTGFFYDKAPRLPEEIEHIMPDYHIYDEFIQDQIKQGTNPKEFKFYTDFSIGFTTRGCIRHCAFCVNKNYNKCSIHSSLSEFVDPTRPYISCLDDNIFACSEWEDVFKQLQDSGKQFQFKQGLDERLLTEEKLDYLIQSKYYGKWIFAFDNYKDKDIIIKKLKMIRSKTHNECRFYMFCGFNHNNPGVYNDEFFLQDFTEIFERLRILMQYDTYGYIMRYKDVYDSEYAPIYSNIARWVNQPGMYKTTSFRQYLTIDNSKSARFTLQTFEEKFPSIIENGYIDVRFNDVRRSCYEQEKAQH